jgi:acyl-[acyl-carrier-protein]-phospholipid O-acyltransferase/long-chain-fatty-acid--[acyl-carrier-protein] ligase
MKHHRPSLGPFHWHNLAQFGGALNDNLFKLLVIYTMVVAWPEKDRDEVNAIVGAVFAIPFLLFIGAAGVLADRVRKHRIVRAIKLLEVGVMTFGAAAVYFENRWMLLGGMFLMSFQSSLFSPCKFGILPELVGRNNLSRANSLMQAAGYLAMILGTVAAPLLYLRFGNLAGTACILVAMAGLIGAFRIEPTPLTGSDQKASVFFLKDIFRSLKFIHQDGFLALAVWGSAFFLLIAAFIQLNILAYGPEHLLMSGQEKATNLFLMVALGIGSGSLAAGRVSRQGIEFGIVPVGSAFMALSCVGLWLLPVGAVTGAYVLCFVMGFGAGLFLVPVQSFLQFRAPPDQTGGIIAASGWLSWVGVLLAAGLLHFCAVTLDLTAAEGFLVIGGLVAVMTVVSFVVLPDFFIRLMILMITRCFYRLRASGLENLPAQGGALLVCNHVSMMDAVWINAIQQRRIRFVMSRTQIAESRLWLRILLKLGRVIPIHTDDSPKALLRSMETARNALREGFLVCIFPEGALTRTGHLLPFKPGFERIAKGTDVPIIPMYLSGAYGSRASFVHGAPTLLHPADFLRPLHIEVGEPMPTDSTTAQVRREVQHLAARADDSIAPVRGSAARCFIKNARRNWKQQALADSSGKKVTFGRALTGALVLKDRIEFHISGDPEEVGVLLPPSVGGALVNVALALGNRVSVNFNYTASTAAQASAMEQAGIHTLITSKAFVEKFPDTPNPGRILYAEDLVAEITKGAKLRGLLKAACFPVRWLVQERFWEPSDPLTILFSSGSTANPKGIVLSHQNILSNIDGFSVVARPQQGDVICSVLPFFHSFGFTAGLWFPLTKGLGVAYHHHPLETDAISRIAKENRCTILMGTPTFLMAWVRKIDPEAFANLRWAVAGAEKLRPKLADMFEKRYGIRPLEGYGATECSPVIAVNVPDLDIDGLKQQGTLEGSVGRPLPNLQVKVTDPETGEECPTGSPGLLWVKGPSVMKQYLNNPDKTREVLVDGWYNTGDIVKLDENGFITITDRLTRFSKLAGEMVSHSAVEEAIQKAIGCPPDQLAVTGVSDDRKGERLVVVYAEELGKPEDFQEAIRAMDIPNLWKPDSRSWVAVDALPTLGTGKLDLKGLKEMAQTVR